MSEMEDRNEELKREIDVFGAERVIHTVMLQGMIFDFVTNMIKNHKVSVWDVITLIYTTYGLPIPEMPEHCHDAEEPEDDNDLNNLLKDIDFGEDNNDSDNAHIDGNYIFERE